MQDPCAGNEISLFRKTLFSQNVAGSKLLKQEGGPFTSGTPPATGKECSILHPSTGSKGVDEHCVKKRDLAGKSSLLVGDEGRNRTFIKGEKKKEGWDVMAQPAEGAIGERGTLGKKLDCACGNGCKRMKELWKSFVDQD